MEGGREREKDVRGMGEGRMKCREWKDREKEKEKRM